MSYKRQEFSSIGFEEKVWYNHYHQNQIDYLRVRLRCVKYYSEGHDFAEISEKLKIGERSVRNKVNLYIRGGYELLLKRVTRKQPTLLTSEQEQAFKATILNTKPMDHGILANIWTGAVMIDYVQKTFGVVYKSGIYELLDRLNLSHQRAHADYSNADPEAQTEFLAKFEETLYVEPQTTAFVFADEFSLCEKPSTYYG